MTQYNQQSHFLPYPNWRLLSLVWLLTCSFAAQAEQPPVHINAEPDYSNEYPDEDDAYECEEDFLEHLSAITPEEQAEESAFSFLDNQQAYISDYVRRVTTSVDQFLANTDHSQGYSGSFMRLTWDTTWREGGDISTTARIKFRLHLPQTQRKLKLIIESEPDEKRNIQDLETRGAETGPASDRNKGLYTGLESQIGKGEKWKVRPSLGLRIRSPLDPYVRLRASREKVYTDWKLYFHESLYLFDSTGFGADTTMDWDYGLTDKLIFRSSSFLRYTDERDQFDMSQSFNLIHRLSKKRAVTYKVAVFADSEPALFATSYLINARYRQNVHKDYLFIELQPQILYQKINQFDPEYSLFLRMEIYYRG